MGRFITDNPIRPADDPTPPTTLSGLLGDLGLVRHDATFDEMRDTVSQWFREHPAADNTVELFWEAEFRGYVDRDDSPDYRAMLEDLNLVRLMRDRAIA